MEWTTEYILKMTRLTMSLIIYCATKVHRHHFVSSPFISQILFHCGFPSCFVAFVRIQKKIRNEISVNYRITDTHAHN